MVLLFWFFCIFVPTIKKKANKKYWKQKDVLLYIYMSLRKDSALGEYRACALRINPVSALRKNPVSALRTYRDCALH
jgi:hypothetical protein